MRASLVVATLTLCCVNVLAGTVRDRFQADPSFKLYVVVFKITQDAAGMAKDIQFTHAYDIRYQHDHPGIQRPAKIHIPDSYFAAATKWIRAAPYPQLKHKDNPPWSFVGGYYAPALGDRFIADLSERE